MPAANILIRYVIREQATVKLESVSVSNNIVQRRTVEMSVDIADQVIEGVRASKYGFVIQLDESTDITNWSQPLAYVRFTQNYEPEAVQYKKRNFWNYFFKQNELDWRKLVGCPTDRLPLARSIVRFSSPPETRITKCSPLFHTKIRPSYSGVLSKVILCLNQVIRIEDFVKTLVRNPVEAVLRRYWL